MTETLVETEVETRSAQVADVNFPKRIVTVVAMPYEQPTEVMYRGRLVSEVVSRGAFDGIERRTSQIKVNRDHDPRQALGKIVGLHPSRTEGLVAEIKISDIPLGHDSLTLANDGVLGASAGFELLRRGPNGLGPVYPDAEAWENSRSVRRLKRLRLDHLALVSNPAYPGAVVVDVRDAARRLQEGVWDVVGTPNKDRLAHDALVAQHEQLNRRWAH